MNGQEGVLHSHSGILLSPKKDWNLAFAMWMDLEGIAPSEISQMRTNAVQFHLYVALKPNQNKRINKSHRYREQAGGCWRGGGLGGGQRFRLPDTK